MSKPKIPTFDQLMDPLFQALIALGGSGNIDEINEKIFETEKIPDEILDIPHGEKGGGRSEIEYRIAWSRTYMKKYGLIENTGRGVWSLTGKAKGITQVDPTEVLRFVREEYVKGKEGLNKDSKESKQKEVEEKIEEEIEEEWRAKLRKVFLEMDSTGFERLIQLVLRHSGFVKVEVTGRTGDGGIDGKGIASINGILSFHVMFQCKKYRGSVSSPEIRDFRGAMQGRADKGIFVTTGTYTRDAIKESSRDGAPPIDLIDGNQLMEMLRSMGLGIKKKIVEEYEVDEEWYKSL